MVYLSQASHSLLQSQEMLMYPKATSTQIHPPTEIKKSSWIISFLIQLGPVEIAKTNQMSTSTGYLFSTYYIQRGIASHSCLCFGRDLKAGRGVGSVIGREEKEDFGCALIVAGGQHQHQEANQKWDILCDWLDELIQLSLAAPQPEVGRRAGKLSIINKVLAWPDCHRSYHLASWVVTRDSDDFQMSNLQQ